MSDSLRKHLNDLHIAIEYSDVNKASQCIDDIKHIVVDQVHTPSELELQCHASLLFSDKCSLLKFLRATHCNSSFKKCVEDGLLLIQKITTSWDNLSHVGKIAAAILEMYPSRKSSSSKEKIIHILVKMVEKTQSQDIDCMNIRKIFQEEVDRRSKSSSTVKCGFLHLMGLLCQYYPDKMKDQFERLVTIYLKKLQHEFDRSSDLKIIEGCLKGLSCMLLSFEIRSKSQCEEVFKYTMKSMQPKASVSRHAVTIAGLTMIQHHIGLFDCFIVEHYEKVYNVLERWLKSINSSVKHEAHMAILSFLKQIAAVVDKESEPSVSRNIYMFFVTKFQNILESSDLSSKEVSIAIQGYGMFARLGRKCMDGDYLAKMLSVIMSKTSLATFRSDGKRFQLRQNQLYQMSNLLSSLACIITEIIESAEASHTNNDEINTIINERFLGQVLQICLHVVEGLHFVSMENPTQFCSSLVSVMSSLSPRPDSLQTFVSKFVSQGLKFGIFTNLKISQKMHQTQMQSAEDIVDISTDSRMVKANWNYIAFWNGMLQTRQNISTFRPSDRGTDKNRVQVNKFILKEIMQTVHKMLKKLEQDNDREELDDQELSNHDIIRELANFWERFLSYSTVSIEMLSQEIFTNEAYGMTATLLRMSLSTELSSGAYDMLTTLITTCCNLGYFNSASDMEMKDSSNSLHCSSAQWCLKLMTKAIPEIVARITEYDFEATCSALLFILSMPSEIAMEITKMLVKPLQAAFRLGLSNVYLADAALNALDRWKLAKESTLPACFVNVLSDIALYICGDESVNARTDFQSVTAMKTSRFGATQKTMKEIKTKALRFLGSVSGCFPMSALVEDRELNKASLQANLMKDAQSYIISLPGTEAKLPLSQVLSHVCELAGNSTDRQVKLTSCEVLHSVMMLSIGQIRQNNLNQSSSSWGELYQYLIPEVIKLGCDSDPITRTLFESLVMQIIHWFAEEEGANSVILLDVIMNGLVDESDEIRRDFCARCLGDFVVSISNQYGDSNDAAVELAKPIFEQLCNFANHPKSDIRRSAAVGFSALLNIIGESKRLLDEFIFQLLNAFVSSLARSHSDSCAIDAIRACSQALHHIENLIITNKDMLILENKKRKGFTGIDSDAVCLETVIEWLLKQTARTESACRKFCMQLVAELCVLVPNTETIQQWIQRYIEKHGIDQLCSIFNGNIVGFHDSSLSDGDKSWTINHAKRYIEYLLPSLDCYSWAISQSLLSSDQLAEGLMLKLLQCVDHFITEIMFPSHSYQKHSEDQTSSHKVDSLKEIKYEVVQMTLHFAHLLFQSPYIPEEYVTQPILNLISSCLIDPTSIGLDVVGECEEYMSFSDLLTSLISSIDKWPDGMKSKSISTIRSKLGSNKIFVDPMECIQRSNCGEIYKLSWTYGIVLKSQCLQVFFPEMTVEKQIAIGQNILNMVFSMFVNGEDCSNVFLQNDEMTNEKISVMLLKLAFNLGVKSNDIVNLILVKSAFHNVEGMQLSTHGALFFSKCKAVLCEEICSRPQGYIPAISKECTTETGIHIFKGVIDILLENRILQDRFAVEFVETVFTCWWDHITQVISKESAKELTCALPLISKLIAFHPKVASDVKNPKREALFKIFSSTLRSKKLDLQIKIEILPCLRHFVPPNRDILSEDLRSCLFEFCSIHYPSRSTEFQEGSRQLNDYLTSLRHILAALEKTGSPEVMSVLASVLCKEPDHILKDDFATALSACMRRVPDNIQQEATDNLYTLHSSSPHSVVVRCRIGDMMLLPVLSQCSRESTEAFFVSHIGEIMGCIAEDLKKVSTDSWKDKLPLKSFAYKLIRVMFNSLLKDVLTSESSPLIMAFASSAIGQGSTKMLKNLMSWIIRDKSMDITTEKKLLGEELRQFYCCMFNAAIAAVTCTQTEIKWFDAFIFSHNPKKNDLLFENIVDGKKVYIFPRRKWSNAYNSKISTKKAVSVKMENESYEPTVSSLSSFNYDAARFDMNAPANSTSDVFLTGGPELENDEMNKHECIQNLKSAIFSMKEKLIGFPVEYASNFNQYPPAKWMVTLIQRMNSEANINVKIFIVKLIMNSVDILEPYSTHFLVPIIKVIVQYMKSGSKSDERSKIDQFVIDTLNMIISWKHETTSKENHEEKLHIRALVEVLMQHCPNESIPYFKSNLALFRNTLDSFKKKLSDVNTDFIYHYSAGSSAKNTETVQSLHLLASLLSNGLSAYCPSIDVKEIDYFDRIFGHILHSSKSTVDIASRVMGMSLRYLSRYHHDTDGEIHDLAKSILRRMANSAKSQGSAMITFISSLFKLAAHYPPVVMPFINDMLYLLPKVPSPESKCHCMEIIRMCMSEVDDIIAELKAKDFLDMLIYRNEPLQHSCMKLLNKLVDLSISSVNEKKFDLVHFDGCIAFFLPHLRNHMLGHQSFMCRQEMYTIAMKVLNFQILQKSDRDSNVFNDAKYILIHGLGDSAEILRLQVMNFWSENLHRIAKCDISDLGGKLIALFEYLYTPEADELGFLTSCCDILMRSTCQNSNFTQDVFDRSLWFNCKYEDISLSQYLDPNKKGQKTSQKNRQETESYVTVKGTNSTNNESKAPASSLGTFNWMTGETYSDTVEQNEETTPYSNVTSGMQDTTKQRMHLRKMNKKAQRFSTDREGSLSDGSLTEKFRLYKTYRSGKLPDLKISHSDVLVPLTALTQCSPAFLRCLMSTLINAILRQHKESMNLDSTYMDNFSEVLEGMLSKSKQHNPTFIACILTVILTNIESLSIDTSIVSQVAKKSGQTHLGIRIIEEKILSAKETSEPRRKRQRLSENESGIGDEEMQEWMSLARLYSNDLDMLHGIFSVPEISRSRFKDVMHLESEGEYKKALKIYEKALTEEMDSQTYEVEKTLWEDCLLNCLEKLTKWSDVDKFCMTQMDKSLSNVMNKPEFQERFLVPSLHAKSSMMMQGHTDSREELWKFLSNALKEDDMEKRIVERDHCYLIALVQAHKGDYGQALFYLDLALSRIGNAWKTHDKGKVMSQLMHITDLGDYIELMRNDGKILTPSAIEVLCHQWGQRLPNIQANSLNVWEDMATNRCYFMDGLVQSLPSSSDNSSMKKLVAEFKIDMYVDSINQACKEKCFNKASKFINENVANILRPFNPSNETDFLGFFKHSIGLGRYYLHFSRHLMALNKDSRYLGNAASRLVESYTCLKEASRNDILTEHQSKRSMVFTLLGQNLKLMMDLVEYKNADSTVLNAFGGLLGPGSNSDHVKELIGQEGYNIMKKTVDETSKSCHVTNNCVEMFITFAKLCDQVLQNNDPRRDSDDITDTREDNVQYAKEVIRYTLRAMQYGGKYDSSQEAIIMFPRLLQLVEQFPQAKSFFSNEAEEVPTWMFLKWISQMIAILDKPESDAVHSIISKLSEEYPQAVIYAVKTSLSQFRFEKTESGKKSKKFVGRLLCRLGAEVPEADTFIKNLTMLINPVFLFKSWHETACSLLCGGDSSFKSQLFTNYQNMYNQLFASHLDGSLPDSTTLTLHGRFAKEFHDVVVKTFGGPIGGAILRNKRSFQPASDAVLASMKKKFNVGQPPSSLKEYSHWLANFHVNCFDGCLEIPGQYNKVSHKPIPEYHVKIMGFDDSVLTLQSLRQPRKIILRGTDSKKYPYMVKGNEDLRQDQRIQQLFETVNIALQRDPDCFNKNLRIETYQVIPVTDKLGLVEWVENSTTLQDMLTKELKRTNRGCCPDKAVKKYHSWVMKFSPAKSTARPGEKEYRNMVKQAKFKQTLANYNAVIAEMPPYILRESLQRLCINPETFLTLRKRFVSIYGTLCAVHWILGIGDRHASNCLISEKNGSVIGIDFGHAFGSATELIPVPELVPFRLTPQISNVMVPHPINEGLLRQCMLYSLHALRRNQETIFAMLDVFLKEPSIDWIKRASQLQRQQESSSGKSTPRNASLAWYPSKKIDHVKAKLQGGNPVAILREELLCNSSISSCIENYRMIAEGTDSTSRVKFPPTALSVDQQVDSLLQLATDPNVLGRTYSGWRFWF